MVAGLAVRPVRGEDQAAVFGGGTRALAEALGERLGWRPTTDRVGHEMFRAEHLACSLDATTMLAGPSARFSGQPVVEPCGVGHLVAPPRVYVRRPLVGVIELNETPELWVKVSGVPDRNDEVS